MINILIKKFEEGSLREFKDILNLKEDIDYGCHFIIANNKFHKLIGLVGFNIEKEKYPRFEHILISPEYQKTRLGVKLMLKMEEYIFNYLNKGCYLSYILNTDERMKSYARKWGMKSFQKDEQGEWFFKTPGKEK